MSFFLRILFVSALFFSFFYSSIHARPLDEVIASKELRVCLVSSNPSMSTATPKGCIDDCQFEGPAYDKSLAFAKSLKKDIQVKFKKIDWDQQFHNSEGKTVRDDTYTPQLLESGQCDFYPNNLTENTWRLKKMDFVMLFPSRMMVMAHKSDKKKYKSAKDLQGKSAAVSKNSSYHTWLDKENHGAYSKNPVKLQLTASSTVAVKELANANIDFTLSDANSAIWETRHDYPELVVTFPVGGIDKISWGFRKSDKKLQKAVNRFFKKQRKNPKSELNQIWKKYYGMTLTKFIAFVSVIR